MSHSHLGEESNHKGGEGEGRERRRGWRRKLGREEEKEGLNYGLNNLDKSCREWLEDLDYKNNKWKNRR